MKTMGLSRLSLVNPKHFPDPQAVARAADADDILEQAQVCSSLDEALAGTVQVYALSARQRNLGPPAMPAREAASDILGWAGEGEVALLFGNETAGLSNAEVQRCQRTVFIPANPDYSSLNLASAVQLLCYELRLAAFDGRPPVHYAGRALRLAAGAPRGHRTLLSAPRAGDGQQWFPRPAATAAAVAQAAPAVRARRARA
jgi:tRNA/rRNA methyltransferase